MAVDRPRRLPCHLAAGGVEGDQLRVILEEDPAVGDGERGGHGGAAVLVVFLPQQIAAVVKEGGYDMVLLGKETIDYNGSQVGAMLAEILDQQFVSYATKLEMNGNTATIEREIEGGKEVLEIDTPFVLSAAKGMAEARIPNMRGIMMAKSKPKKRQCACNWPNCEELSTQDSP